MICVSLFDKTGLMLEPWARAGYRCINVDWENVPRVEGLMEWVRADIWTYELPAGVTFVAAFPECTDLTRSGALHWKAKAAVDPEFQKKAIGLVQRTLELCEASGAPYLIENPPGILSTEWKPPHEVFSPSDYGQYCPAGRHPLYPRYWPAQDAYAKPTCLWTGGGFVMPLRKPVPIDPEGANAFKKLGGASRLAKDIRSATPRGFAEAVFRANCPMAGLL